MIGYEQEFRIQLVTVGIYIGSRVQIARHGGWGTTSKLPHVS